MKNLLLALLAFLTFTFTTVAQPLQTKPKTEKQQPKTRKSQPKDYTVYITKTGAKYHSDGCQYLRRSQISIGKKNAVNQGYSACSRCSP